MKKLFKALKQFFINLLYFKRWQKAKQYEKLLKNGILNREVEKIKVLREASVLIPKKTKKGKSEYIPLSILSKARIKAVILKEFGYKMNLLGMKITDDLKFI
jgi:hypothetical protein